MSEQSKGDLFSFKHVVIGTLVVVVGIYFLGSLIKRNSPEVVQEYVYVEKKFASEGLDLQAVLELTKKTKDAEALETLLNVPDGVNNLDLDEDGKVDYIHVSEFGESDFRGLSLSVKTSASEEQEIAVLEFEKKSDSVEAQIRGNQQVYGSNYYYHSRLSLADVIFFNYLFRPHRYWASPYRYGYYPSYWNSHRTVARSTYRNNVNPYKSGASSRKVYGNNINKTVKSPNAGKSANNIKAKLKNPSVSQKSFQSKNSSSRSGGFGRNSSRGYSSSSVRRSSYSGRSFGGK